MKKLKKIQPMDIIAYTVLTLITLVILYPLYFTVIASFSEPNEVVQGRVFLWIKQFTIDSYVYVFETDEIWIGYRNNLIYTIFGTMLSLILTIPAAYALSKKFLWHRNLITTFFVIIMYFSGGMLPTYLNVKNLELLNKPYTLIILGAFSVYNMVITRSFFQTSIPESLYEAADIDGCSQVKQFFMIALPLAKPIIAVIALYYAAGKWNDYFSSLIYISSTKYYSLQMVLRNILTQTKNALVGIDIEMLDQSSLDAFVYKIRMAEAMKYSVIVIGCLPMLIVYPFVQKHFVKGVMVGAIKE